jgi:nucleoside 2-deoxyribosyltransferase
MAEIIDPNPRVVYFADNARLWPDADAAKYRAHVEDFCVARGIQCIWPSEHYLLPDELQANERADADLPRLLPLAPLVHLRKAVAVIADVSPLRGPHLNPVVAFEIGAAVASGLPVFGWSDAVVHQRGKTAIQSSFVPLIDRLPGDVTEGPGANTYDSHGFKIENFGLIEDAIIVGNLKSLSMSLKEAIRVCADYFARPRPEPEATKKACP